MSKIIPIIGLVLAVGLVLGSFWFLHAPVQAKGFPALLNAAAEPLIAKLAVSDSDVTAKESTIMVTASGKQTLSATKVEIELAVVTVDSSAQQSQQKNAVQTQKVIDALKAAGILATDIKTVSFSLYQKTEWDESYRKVVSRGYETVNTIQATVNDITKTGKVLDAAVTAGANQVSDITFTLDEAALKNLKRDALKTAAQEALAKAQAIASGLGVSLGKVQSASENSFVFRPYTYKYALDASAQGGAASPETPIVPGTVEVNADLTVTYTLK